jgi:hypothetical protein
MSDRVEGGSIDEKVCPQCKVIHSLTFDDAIRRRGWNLLKWECPHCVLVEEFPLVMTPDGPAVANITRESHQSVIERHEASVLAYGLMNRSVDRVPVRVAFGPKKHLDVVEDAVIRYVENGMVKTFPVQQKRVTRSDMDPHDEVSERLADLATYPVKDLVGLVSIERTFSLEFGRLIVPPMRIAGFWIANSEDGIAWWLHRQNSNTKEWEHLRFIYPSVLPEESTVRYD